MSIPKNPETIILKNNFYPRGLKEYDVYNYYQNKHVKESIVNQLKNRNVVMFIVVEDEKIVVRRNIKDKPIIVNNINDFDNIVTGRTLTFLPTIKSNDDICLIDIDTDNFKEGKEIVKISYNLLNNIDHLIKYKEIRYTGKNSFHIYCQLNRQFNMTTIRRILDLLFKRNNKDMRYTVSNKRGGKKPNIDLFRNVENGAFVALNSLSMWGLRCMKVDLKDFDNFRKDMAII